MKTTRIVHRTPSAYSYPLLIGHLLNNITLYAPRQQIVYRDLVRHTYEDLYIRIHRLASGLSGLGVGPGDTVAVMDYDSHRYLECFFSIPMMGAILHTVNFRLSPEQILYTMNHAEDTVLLVHEDFLPMLEKIADQLTTVKTVILLKDGAGQAPTVLPMAPEYEAMLARAKDSFDFPEFPEDSQATLFYTTGTTGAPKGVYFSHRQLVVHTLATIAAVAGYKAQGRLYSDDVYMPLTPMFHVHGWGFPYVATMLGAKQVYPGRYEPDMILNLILREKVTFSHCVPTILHMLLNSPKAKEVNLSGWKVVIGGGALPKGLAKASLDSGVDVYTGYGMSETCPVLTLANLKPHMLDWDMEHQAEVRIKTGFPIPLVDLKIVDETGEPVPRDGTTQGEILVRTPWLTQGYYRDPERSEELWRGGWLHTGDIAVMDEEGYVRITDRLKDVIKTGGEWVSSLELESFISQHPAVLEVAVIGLADEKWGERPVALVVLRPGHEEAGLQEGIRAFLGQFVEAGHLSKWAVPDQIKVVKEIPKTSVGKINKRVIRQEIAKNR